MKKIKIFLGGYINVSNAQNLNCLALCKYLDKDKFEISTMSFKSGNLLIEKSIQDKISIFECKKPYKIFQKLGYLYGILKSDILYLPKIEYSKWNMFFIKILNKKVFTTIEIIFDQNSIQNITKNNNKNFLFKHFNSFENKYSITNFMKDYNLKNLNIKSKDKILYLGTEIDTFLNEDKKSNGIKKVLIIGSDLVRKGIDDYLELAKIFSNIEFHIVGSGNGKIDINKIIKENNFKNIVYHGTQTHSQIVELLKTIDLHIFPSRSEGFPKVTLETAASGVPSLVYSDYGASEWIKDHHDGFVVDTLDKMKETIQELIENPELLEECSKNSIELAKRFDWKVLIKDWENEIIRITNENS